MPGLTYARLLQQLLPCQGSQQQHATAFSRVALGCGYEEPKMRRDLNMQSKHTAAVRCLRAASC
jgi:hypothetical protein